MIYKDRLVIHVKDERFVPITVDSYLKERNLAKSNLSELSFLPKNTEFVSNSLFVKDLIPYVVIDTPQESTKVLNDLLKTPDDYPNAFILIVAKSTRLDKGKVKKLEKIGCSVEKRDGDARSILNNETNLPNNTKNYILDIIGNETGILVSFLEELQKISFDEQYKITPDQIDAFFVEKGGVEGYLFLIEVGAKNKIKAVDLASRALNDKSTNVFSLTAMLRNRMFLLYKASLMYKTNQNLANLAKTFGYAPFTFQKSKYFIQNAEKARKGLLLAGKLEEDLKNSPSSLQEPLLLKTIAQIADL